MPRYILISQSQRTSTLAIFLFLSFVFTMRIIHVASEMAPIAKAGGLADVLFGLPRALQEAEHEVSVILPKYDCIDYSHIEECTQGQSPFFLYMDGLEYPCSYFLGKVGGIDIILLDCDHPSCPFSRGRFYGESDDAFRFCLFSLLTLDFLWQVGFQNQLEIDILHFHDWQTAFLPVLYRAHFAHRGLQINRLCFTIHNLNYQGTMEPELLERFGLPRNRYFTPPELMDPRHLWVNLLKGGIYYADHITTVSPTYAQEALSELGGRGLQDVIQNVAFKFSGILNGIDYTYWNPSTDPMIPCHYSSGHLQGKAELKRALQERLNLTMDPIVMTKRSKNARPIVACVARLVPQKGIELIRHALYYTLACGGQFILAGSSPIPEVQAEFVRIKEDWAHCRDLHLELDYNEGLVHWIYGGADILIVPSLFEPCGLTQMIALRYGTVPLVRKTGGLADSIIDLEYHQEGEVPNGFVFEHPDTQSIAWALDRAFSHYREESKWKALIQAGMECDFSWKQSCQKYIEVYTPNT